MHAFARSMELGVTTLELDTHLSRDGVVMIWHDHRLEPSKCRDTRPVAPQDPQFPYVGHRLQDLTLAQIQTVDCGHQQLPGFLEQEVVQGNRMATLRQAFDLARQYKAQNIRWNIEIKVEDSGAAWQREALVDAVLQEITTYGWPKSTQLQSFDWAALDRAAPLVPDLELVALARAQNPAGAGLSPFEVADHGYHVWSPRHLLLTERNIHQAKDLGLKVVPWTVNSPDDMARLMDWGVDGLITDYPRQLRGLMQDRGLPLPTTYIGQD